MKPISVVSAAVLAVLSTTALAADMTPVFKTLPANPAAPNWSGLYGGFNAGYSWGQAPYDSTVPGGTASGTLTTDSFIGGGQFGYNIQMGSTVLGIEADIAWRRGTDTAVYFGPNALDSMTLRGEQGWVGTLRPRVGVAVDNWLVYGTGGLAYGFIKHNVTETIPGNARSASESETKAGWTVGAGVEFAAGHRWSLGLEYLYADFGKTTINQAAQGSFPASSSSFQDQSHLLRGKFNYHFDWNTFPATKK